MAIWIIQLVNYMDRVNISIAAPTMMKDLAIDPISFGFVLSAFALGYACMQLPSGFFYRFFTMEYPGFLHFQPQTNKVTVSAPCDSI